MSRLQSHAAEDFYRRSFTFAAIGFIAAFCALLALGLAVRHDRVSERNTQAVLLVSDLLSLNEHAENDTMAAVLRGGIEIRASLCLEQAEVRALSGMIRSGGEGLQALCEAMNRRGSGYPWTAKELAEMIRAHSSNATVALGQVGLARNTTGDTRARVTADERIKTAEGFFGVPYAFVAAGEGVAARNLFALFTGRFGQLQSFSAVFDFSEGGISEEVCIAKALEFAEKRSNMLRCRILRTETYDGILWAVVRDMAGRQAKIGISSGTGQICYYLPVNIETDI